MSNIILTTKREPANTRAKTNLDGSTRIVDMELTEEECSKAKFVKCKVCHKREHWDKYIFLMGANPKFCKCKPGEEEIVTVWE